MLSSVSTGSTTGSTQTSATSVGSGNGNGGEMMTNLSNISSSSRVTTELLALPISNNRSGSDDTVNPNGLANTLAVMELTDDGVSVFWD